MTGFLFEDENGELLDDFDPAEYECFFPMDLEYEEFAREEYEQYMDMYDQLSYMAEHSD